MKYIDAEKQDEIAGRRLGADDTFCFRCHPQIACFNQCCRNLNLFLYPYDVMRLKQHLGISSDEFIERHVDVVLRDGHHFPEVLLRMSENDQQTCPYLTDSGCSVYADRPDTCRTFPVEQGALFDADSGKSTPVYYFRPPDFCLGPREEQQWTVDSWTQDQEAERYHRMTRRWAEIRRLFQNDPWGVEGPQGAKARMAFMAAYNLDRFRDFLFASTFFKRYRVKPELKRKLRTSDQELMVFGFEWIKFFVWGIQSKQIRVK
jgi:Fe-S-cluster containining protein